MYFLSSTRAQEKVALHRGKLLRQLLQPGFRQGRTPLSTTGQIPQGGYQFSTQRHHNWTWQSFTQPRLKQGGISSLPTPLSIRRMEAGIPGNDDSAIVILTGNMKFCKVIHLHPNRIQYRQSGTPEGYNTWGDEDMLGHGAVQFCRTCCTAMYPSNFFNMY